MRRLLGGLCTAVTVRAPAANAHFRLIAPASWIVENALGDPQTSAPCGGTLADPGTPTGAVTEVQGGQMLRVEG